MTAETQVFAQTEELATEYEYDEHMYGEERIEFELRELGRLIDGFEQAQPQQAEFLGFGRWIKTLKRFRVIRRMSFIGNGSSKLRPGVS